MTKKAQDSPQGLWMELGYPAAIFFLVLLTLCGAQAAHSATQTVTVITSQGRAYQDVGDRVYSSLANAPGIELRAYDVGELDVLDTSGAELKSSDLVITVGTSALKYMASNHSDASVLAVFVTSYSYKAVMAEVAPNEHHFFGLFIDQPLDRYLHLARLLLPNAKALSISGINQEGSDANDLTSASTTCNFQLEKVQMSPDSNPIRLLDSYYSRSDAFLVFPQSTAQDRNSAKWILYLASRHRKPVIAFSEKYVDGGALASVFATPADIAKETHEILRQWQQTGIPETAWGKTGNVFTVKTNSRIARFLKLKIASESRLTQNLAKEGLARDCGSDEG